MRIAFKQRLIVEWRHVVTAQIAGVVTMAACRNNGIHIDDRAMSAFSVGAAHQRVEIRAAGVRDLFHVVQADGVAVIDPLKWHTGNVCSQNFLRQADLRKSSTATPL